MGRNSRVKAKGKIVRRLGLNIYGNPKYDRLLEKRPTPPGMHTRRRGRPSEYGLQLVEKQKLRFAYGMTERQFRTLFAKAKHMTGIAGDNMLILLERRLDNVVYRMGMAATRAQARQAVRHGHIHLNGHKATSPSQLISVDDKIAPRAKESSKNMIKEALESGKSDVPGWLAVDEKAVEGLMIRMPDIEEIPVIADVQLIVEFYSK
jgi:small subunit ribosomal protein S4